MSHAYLCGSALRLLWSCVTRSRNQFYVFAFLVVRDLRLRFELRNSQPQFVFRFCDFLDVNLQDFVWKFFAEELFLIPENGTYRPRPREGLGRTPELGRLPILRTSVDLPETADFREQYFCGAAIQSASNYYYYYYCLIAPPLYLTYLILSRT